MNRRPDAAQEAEAPSALQNAIDRGIAKYRADAEREVEAILDAALRVAERAAPAAPKVVDIIAEAGTSNQAFYRYFAGKDDLLEAVRERGTRQRLHDYLAHQMDKATDPAGAVTAWVRGALTQAVHRRAARQSAAVNLQLTGRLSMTDDAGTAGLRTLLRDALTDYGSADPDRDTAAVFEAVFGTLRRHLVLGTAPSAADLEHLVAFTLRALTPAAPLRRRGQGGG